MNFYTRPLMTASCYGALEIVGVIIIAQLYNCREILAEYC